MTASAHEIAHRVARGETTARHAMGDLVRAGRHGR